MNRLTLLLVDPKEELATNAILELVEKLTNKHIPSLLYEHNSEQQFKKLKSSEDKLNKSKVLLGQTLYLEDICNAARKHKKLYNIKILIIDGLTEISTKQPYCLGRGDIVSIIIQKLKKLAQELNIHIIATAPTKQNIYGLNSDKSKLLAYFCKAETAKDYVDRIIVLEKE